MAGRKKKDPKPRIVGVYPKQNRFEIRFVDTDGKQKSRYRKSKRSADALAKQLGTRLRNIATASDDDIDWYALLRKTARAAYDAGDYTAVVSAAKAAVTFMPPPPPPDTSADLSKADKEELFNGFIQALEAEGYKISRPREKKK
jgi:hypothetical protein